MTFDSRSPVRWHGVLVGATLAAAVAGSANAGLILKQVTTNEGGHSADGDSGRMVTEVVMEGGKVKMTILEGGNPMMGPGSYVLKTNDAMLLVNPDRKSYMRMDMAELGAIATQGAQTAKQAQNQAADASEQHGFGRGENTVSGFSFKPLVDEPGPTLLGYPTHHYKYELKYKVSRPMQGSAVTMDRSVDRIDEFWTTNAIDLSGVGPGDDLLRMMGGDKTGSDEEFPVIADATQTMAGKGFRLKSISQVKDSSAMGGSMSTLIKIETFGMAGRMGGGDFKQTTEILDVRQQAVPAGTFDLPKGYTETSMMGPTNMPNLNQMPNMPPGMPNMPPGMPNMPPGMPNMPPGMANPNGGGMPDLNQLPPQ
jgi:hypothetical protein